MGKILLVEDDLNLTGVVTDLLAVDLHRVEHVASGLDGQQMLAMYGYDLIILDWELPAVSGVDICKKFRAGGGTTPILILTGKGSADDKEVGLDAGADDYLTKPFNGKELRARVRALLRRPSAFSGGTLSCGDLLLDPVKFFVSRNGSEIRLAAREFALLEFFLRHPGQPFTAEALLARVWLSEEECSLEAVRMCIKRLRTKLDLPGSPPMIVNIHGAGYKLEALS